MEGISFTPQLEKKRAYYYAVKNYRANSNENLDQSFHFFPRPNQKTVKVDIYFGNLENVYIVTAIIPQGVPISTVSIVFPR